MQVWNVLHVACWKYRMQKIAKNSPSGHHHTTLSGYIFTTKAHIDNQKKNLLDSNIPSICSYNMVNFVPLLAEIGFSVCGTSANFNGFRVLPSLLQRRRSPEVNQTLHDVWPSPGLVHYIYIFGGCWPLTQFCKYWQRYCTALQQRVSAKLWSVVQGMELPNFCRGRHLVRLCGHHVGHCPTF